MKSRLSFLFTFPPWWKQALIKIRIFKCVNVWVGWISHIFFYNSLSLHRHHSQINDAPEPRKYEKQSQNCVKNVPFFSPQNFLHASHLSFFVSNQFIINFNRLMIVVPIRFKRCLLIQRVDPNRLIRSVNRCADTWVNSIHDSSVFSLIPEPFLWIVGDLIH